MRRGNSAEMSANPLLREWGGWPLAELSWRGQEEATMLCWRSSPGRPQSSSSTDVNIPRTHYLVRAPFPWSQVKKLRTENLPTAIWAIRGMRARGGFPSESFPFTRTNPWRCRQRGLGEGTQWGQGSRSFLWPGQARWATPLQSLGHPEVRAAPNLQREK